MAENWYHICLVNTESVDTKMDRLTDRLAVSLKVIDFFLYKTGWVCTCQLSGYDCSLYATREEFWRLPDPLVKYDHESRRPWNQESLLARASDNLAYGHSS
jgi:hypothetical protein